MISKIQKTVANIPGKGIAEKIIVFESDDWGAIRMRDQGSFDNLKKAGIPVHQSHYDTLDSLENKADLTALFEVLSKYSNTAGNKPVFTCNTVMGNPDFEFIEKNRFEHYKFRDLFQSYCYYYGEELEPIWKDGINQKLIRPQFHAREHLNVPLWVKDLNAGHKKTRLAFKHHFYGLKTNTSSRYQHNYLAAYSAENTRELEAIKKITQEGLNLFEKYFGYRSESFIAANYVWPKELEPFLKENGVNYIQSQRGHIAPVIDKGGKKIYRHYFGQKNKAGQRYLLRNVLFEPYLNQDKDWIDSTLSEIQNAFFWKKPAIISTHRINYVSNMSVKHRDASLKKLNQLLSAIIKMWPDVQFMSSDQLGNYCFKNK